MKRIEDMTHEERMEAWDRELTKMKWYGIGAFVCGELAICLWIIWLVTT